MAFELDTPVIFLVFNRPDLTKVLFERIAEFKPKTLLVVADGPRSDRPEEAEKCKQVRDLIKPTWKCDLLTNFSDVNLGCKNRVSSGITWAFQHVEEALILEDDCLPSDSFFKFSSELLKRYREDERVMAISGVNFHGTPLSYPYSYSFSRWINIWGWATWRRAWKHYDVDIKTWPAFRDQKQLQNVLHNPMAIRYWKKIFDQSFQGKIDTWDHQWTYAILSQGGLCIQPRRNLITNTGFGPDATHTRRSNGYEAMEREELEFPLSHPPFILSDTQHDHEMQKKKTSIIRRAYFKLKGFHS